VTDEGRIVDLKEFFLKQKQATYKNCLKVFEAIPADRLDWRPAGGMLSLGEIVRHTWMSEDGVRRVAVENKWDYYEKRVPLGLSGILGEVTSLEDELERLDQANKATLAAAAELPIERWDEDRQDDRFDVRTKVAVMLFGINEHQAHHRAQAGVYLHLITGTRVSHYAL
jgi:uncharacterized damage-inducible protein DinB